MEDLGLRHSPTMLHEQLGMCPSELSVPPDALAPYPVALDLIEESPANESERDFPNNNHVLSADPDCIIPSDLLPIDSVASEISVFTGQTSGQTSASDMDEDVIIEMSYELQKGYNILREIMKDAHRSIIAPFCNAVDPEAPGCSEYYKLVEKPIWLQRMKEKFEKKEYATITEFVTDFRLMLENCYRFNGSNHCISKKAQKLEVILEQKLALLSRDLRNKTSIAATKGTPPTDQFLSGTRRRKTIVPHDSTSLLSQLRIEEIEREKEYKKQMAEEKRKLNEDFMAGLQGWEDDLLKPPYGQQMKAMWELPQIGHFLFVCQGPLNIGEIPQYEVERCLLMPRQSAVLQRIMTTLLSTPYQRTTLKDKPSMPYRVWEEKLRVKIRYWYRLFRESKRDTFKMAIKLGIEENFFHVVGYKSPLEKMRFHEISFYQRVWILKSLCDHCMEQHEAMREACDAQEVTELRKYNLGIDAQGNYYFYFPQFCGPDLRVYRQSPLPFPKMEKKEVYEIDCKEEYLQLVHSSRTKKNKRSPVKTKHRRKVSPAPKEKRPRDSRLRQAKSCLDEGESSDDCDSVTSSVRSSDTESSKRSRISPRQQRTPHKVSPCSSRDSTPSTVRRSLRKIIEESKQLTRGHDIPAFDDVSRSTSPSMLDSRSSTPVIQLRPECPPNDEGVDPNAETDVEDSIEVPLQSYSDRAVDATRDHDPPKICDENKVISSSEKNLNEKETILVKSECNDSNMQTNQIDTNEKSLEETIVKSDCNDSNMQVNEVNTSKDCDESGKNSDNESSKHHNTGFSNEVVSNIKQEKDMDPCVETPCSTDITSTKVCDNDIDRDSVDEVKSVVLDSVTVNREAVSDSCDMEDCKEKAESDAGGSAAITPNGEIDGGGEKEEPEDENMQEFKEESSDDEWEEKFPEIGAFELVADSVEKLRALVAKFDEPEPIATGSKRSRSAVKGDARKKCEIELHERLTFLLKELEPWESKLVAINRKAKIKLRKECVSYKEPLEKVKDVWASEESADEESGASDNESTASSHATSNAENIKEKLKKVVKPKKAEETMPIKEDPSTEEISVSARGRVRKRRIIPNNAENQVVKKVKEGSQPSPAADAASSSGSSSNPVRFTLDELKAATESGQYSIGMVNGQPVLIKRPLPRANDSQSSQPPANRNVPVFRFESPPSSNPNPNIQTAIQTLLSHAKPVPASSTDAPSSTSVLVQSSTSTATIPSASNLSLPEQTAANTSAPLSLMVPSTHANSNCVESTIQLQPSPQPKYATNVTVRELLMKAQVSPTPVSSGSASTDNVSESIKANSLQKQQEQINELNVKNELSKRISSVEAKKKSAVRQLTDKGLLETPLGQKIVEEHDTLLNKLQTNLKSKVTVLVQQSTASNNPNSATLQNTSPIQSAKIDKALKAVMTTVNTTLPTAQIRVVGPSPLQMPTPRPHRPVTVTTTSMKGSIPVVPPLSAEEKATNSLPAINAESQPTSASQPLSKNMELKITPRTFTTVNGPVQGVIIPPGVVLPEKVLQQLTTSKEKGGQGLLVMQQDKDGKLRQIQLVNSSPSKAAPAVAPTQLTQSIPSAPETAPVAGPSKATTTQEKMIVYHVNGQLVTSKGQPVSISPSIVPQSSNVLAKNTQGLSPQIKILSKSSVKAAQPMPAQVVAAVGTQQPSLQLQTLAMPGMVVQPVVSGQPFLQVQQQPQLVQLKGPVAAQPQLIQVASQQLPIKHVQLRPILSPPQQIPVTPQLKSPQLQPVHINEPNGERLVTMTNQPMQMLKILPQQVIQKASNQ